MDAVLSRDDAYMRNRSSDIVPFNGCKIADSKHKITCRCSLCMHQLTFCTSITWIQPGIHGSFAPRPQAYVTKCSGVRTFQYIFSFPEREWRQMTGETNDHLPALSAFCKFQRLKVKLS